MASFKDCVLVCLAVCPGVKKQWRRCIDTFGSAGGCKRATPEPALTLHEGTNDCPQIFSGSMYWGSNPGGSVWGDLSQDMTRCPDGSSPKGVQQVGTFDNITACSSYVTTLESFNMFGAPVNEKPFDFNMFGTPVNKKPAFDKNNLLSSEAPQWADLSCSSYSPSVNLNAIKSSCVLPMAKLSNLAYSTSEVILAGKYCQNSHVEVYNTNNKQNFSSYNLQVVMLSCENVVIVSYRGTTFEFGDDNDNEMKNETRNETASIDSPERLVFTQWNVLLDLAAFKDLWVVPISNNDDDSDNSENSKNSDKQENHSPLNQTDGRANAWVHFGFKRALDTVQPFVRTFLKKYYSKTQRLLVTGHSLGGAMATLGSYDLHHGVDGDKYPVTLAVTFGAPRSLGGSWFDSTSLVRYDVPTIRVTHYMDVVPMVPPTLGNLNAWHHVGDELYLQRHCCSSKVCDGDGEDDSCNGGWWFVWAIPGGFFDHGLGNYIKSLGG
jgi:hypothetical protein